jgi:hypothetical protein
MMMSEKEKESFKKANEVVHQVEDQWHYPIMMKYGYVSDTKEGIGFVRAYSYHHPKFEHKVTCSTGYSADYFNSSSGGHGLWAKLEPHLKKFQNL